MKGVGGLVLLVFRDDHPTRGEGFLLLGPPQLGDGQRRGDTHHARRDQRLRVDTHADIRHQHRSRNGGVSGAHDLVDFGHGQVRNERLDQHGGFSLSDEGRRGGDDGLGAGNAHAPKEEHGEFADGPLENTGVVEKLDKRHEEDDGRDDSHQEPAVTRRESVLHQEVNTLSGEFQQLSGQRGDEVEDVVSGLGPQYEERDDELHQHAHDDGVPDDLLAVPRGGPEDGQEHHQSEETDGPVLSAVVLGLLRGERTDDDDRHGHKRGAGDAKLLGNEGDKSRGGLIPDPTRRPHDNRNGHIEEDDAQRDGQIQQEGDQPPQVIPMEDETCNPPSRSARNDEPITETQDNPDEQWIGLPGEQEPDDSIDDMLDVLGIPTVERPLRVAFARFLVLVALLLARAV